MDNCKTICPQSFYLGAYKERIRQKRGRLKIMFPVERLVVGCIGVEPITRRQILDSSKLKKLQTTISNLTKMEESYPNG